MSVPPTVLKKVALDNATHCTVLKCWARKAAKPQQALCGFRKLFDIVFAQRSQATIVLHACVHVFIFHKTWQCASALCLQPLHAVHRAPCTRHAQTRYVSASILKRCSTPWTAIDVKKFLPVSRPRRTILYFLKSFFAATSCFSRTEAKQPNAGYWESRKNNQQRQRIATLLTHLTRKTTECKVRTTFLIPCFLGWWQLWWHGNGVFVSNSSQSSPKSTSQKSRDYFCDLKDFKLAFRVLSARVISLFSKAHWH